MAAKHFLVVRRAGYWRVISDGAQFAPFPSRNDAIAAAKVAAAISERAGDVVEIAVEEPATGVSVIYLTQEEQ